MISSLYFLSKYVYQNMQWHYSQIDLYMFRQEKKSGYEELLQWWHPDICHLGSQIGWDPGANCQLRSTWLDSQIRLQLINWSQLQKGGWLAIDLGPKP